jgi:hypothetical protein
MKLLSTESWNSNAQWIRERVRGLIWTYPLKLA